MRITMSNILSQGQKSIQAVNSALEKIEDKATDLVTKFVLWDVVAKKGREHVLWALAAQVEHNMEVSDWSFGNSLKVFFAEFDTPESKAFAKLDKAEQLKLAKAWSEVVAGKKAGRGSASQQRKGRKQKEQDKPRTYRQVLAEAKALTNEEQQSLLTALCRELGISTKLLKSA